MARHTREFREQAVRQAREGPLSLPELAWSLGVSTNTLRRWMQTVEVREKAAGKVRKVAAALSPEKNAPTSQRFRLLVHALEQSPATIVITDRDGRILYANPRFSETTGYSLEEAIGQNPRFLKSGYTSQEDYQRMWETISGGREWRGVFHNKRKDGSVYWERAAISPVFDATGQIANFMAIKENITEVKEADEARRRLEARLLAVVSTMAEAVLLLDADGRIELCNAAAVELLGAPADRLSGARLTELGLCPEGGSAGDLSAIKAGLRDAIFSVARAGGDCRWLSVNARAVAESVDTAAGLVLTLTDISERRRAEESLRQAATVFDNSVEAIMITDRDNRIVAVNQAFTEVTGYAEAEVLGRNPSLLASGRHDAAFYAAMWQTLAAEGRWQGEIWNRRRDGRLYPEWLSVAAVRDSGGAISQFVALFSDITKGRQRGWREPTLRDPLTGLPTGELLLDRIEQGMLRAAAAGRRLALVLLDLRGFAAVNRSHGHATGDQLLLEAATRLRAALTVTDTLGRRSGDEFLAVLPDLADASQAETAARALLASLAAPLTLGLTVSAAVGVAVYPEDGAGAEDLLAAAASARFKAATLSSGSACCLASQLSPNSSAPI